MLASVLRSKLSAIIVAGFLRDVFALRGVRRIKPSIFGGPSALGEKQPLQVRCVSQNSGAFHRFGPLWARLHAPRQLQRGQRLGFKVEFRPQVFLFLSHGNLRCVLDQGPLIRRSQLTRNPTGRAWFKRVGGHHSGFDVTAFAAFEGALLEALRSCRDGSRYHSRLANGTTRTVDRQ